MSGRRPLFPFATTPPDTLPDMARDIVGLRMYRMGLRSICCNLWLLEIPIKISRLKIKNVSGRRRRLSITTYTEWVLGPERTVCAPYVVTEIDPETGALLARNPWRMEFGSRVAFADLAGRQQSWSGDRTEFIGRNGTFALPAALADRKPLSNRVGAGLDPCGVLQTAIEIPANGEAEITFLLGEAATGAEALSLVERYRTANLDEVFRDVIEYWDRYAGRGPGADARSCDGHSAEPLASVSNDRLSIVGSLGILPGQRCLWLPRPAARRHGTLLVAAGADTGASSARGRTTVCRGRRSTLVVAVIGQGHSHARFR